MNKLEEFIEMSKFAGMREDLVQAGGGNSSVKINNNEMLIKASGFQLAEITNNTGYSIVDQSIINEYFIQNAKNNIIKEDESKLIVKALIRGKRPSIEIFLHSITDIFTLHIHSVALNVILTRKDGLKNLKDMFPSAIAVEYKTPGIELAKEYFKAFERNKYNKECKLDIIFLKNHGIVVSGKSGKEVIEKTENVLKKIEHYLNIDCEKYRNTTFLYNQLKARLNEQFQGIVYLSKDSDIKKLAYNESWNYAFCPDCIVYCGKKPLVLKENLVESEINKYFSEYGRPIVIFYSNNCYICAENVKKAKEIESVLSFSAQVHTLNKNYDMDYLLDEEQNFLLDWESEKYRQNLI
jgi:rhamnose utilization protein RhaD (predicted bifunctional aldolase and dehydrogenase)